MRKFIVLSLLSLMTSLSHAVPVWGGSSDGGGNAVENRMIEEFKVTGPEVLKGYGEFKKRLNYLRGVYPGFAAAIEKAIAKKTWYAIPREFNELPAELTGLRFESDQVAYQNDREVFVSIPSLNNLSEYSAAIKIMHEGLMAMQTERDVTKVRLANLKVMAPQPDAKEIQGALAENDFGIYFTDRQLKLIREEERKNYVSTLAAMLKGPSSLCDPRGPSRQFLKSRYGKKEYQEAWKAIRQLFMANSPYALTYEFEYWNYMGPYGGPNFWEYLRREGSHGIDAPGGYYSPFRAAHYAHGLYHTHIDVRSRIKSAVTHACDEKNFGKPACGLFGREIDIHDEQSKQGKPLTRETGIWLAIELAGLADDDAAQVRRELAKRNVAFARLIAVLAEDARYFDNIQLEVGVGPRGAAAQEILDQARALRASLGNLSVQQKIQSVCADATALAADVDRLYAVLSGKPAPVKSKTPPPLPFPNF